MAKASTSEHSTTQHDLLQVGRSRKRSHPQSTFLVFLQLFADLLIQFSFLLENHNFMIFACSKMENQVSQNWHFPWTVVVDVSEVRSVRFPTRCVSCVQGNLDDVSSKLVQSKVDLERPKHRDRWLALRFLRFRPIWWPACKPWWSDLWVFLSIYFVWNETYQPTWSICYGVWAGPKVDLHVTSCSMTFAGRSVQTVEEQIQLVLHGCKGSCRTIATASCFSTSFG